MARDADRSTEFANTLRQADIFYDLTPQQLGMVARNSLFPVSPKSQHRILNTITGIRKSREQPRSLRRTTI